MNLIREIVLNPVTVGVAEIILIVAALPMVGWSWAVSHMAGPKVKKCKGGHMKAHLSFLCNGQCRWCKNYWDCSKYKKSWQKFSDAKIGDGKTDEGHSPAVCR